MSTVLLLAFFWLGSRYPALNEKAAMGGDVSISGLAFDILVEAPPDASIAVSVAANTVNWIYTNWKGMTFGVLFGACLLTALSLVRYRSFDNPFADSALGATIGAPLGVCVNCAAPIAQGLHSSGTRLETTLSALIASPTLNIIVVSISFALLPTYMATIKLVAMLAFILIAIPLLCRFVLARERAASGKPMQAKSVDQAGLGFFSKFAERFKIRPDDQETINTWPAALGWLLTSFGRNLWFLIWVTVPLMLLAGALGSVVISLVPVASILDVLETLQGPMLIILAMVAMTAFSLFLPVPIAFDVILASVLVTAGMPAKYVVPVLIGLGSFSIYSFLIIGRAISFKTSVVIIVSLAVVALASGVLASKIEKRLLVSSLEAELNILRIVPPPSKSIDSRVVKPVAPVSDLVSVVQPQSDVMHQGAGHVSVALTQLPGATSPNEPGNKVFTRLTGEQIGLNHGDLRNDLEAFEPYTYYWAIAAGDIHGDGWDDIVIANDAMQGGISVYANQEGRFALQSLSLGELDNHFVNAAALVDLNNDSRLDLFVSTYLAGAFVYWNDAGRFDASSRTRLPNGSAPMIGAPGFADLDGDGYLDIVAANWSVGTMTSLRNPHLPTSADRIIWNDKGKFTTTELQGIPGESLTSIITDINGDGAPDIVIGDDIAKSDKIYLNAGRRRFELLKKSEQLVPWLTYTTMSFDTGDFNNDQNVDFYAAQIARPATSSSQGRLVLREEICRQQTRNPGNVESCFRRERERVSAANKPVVRTERCDLIEHPPYRTSCAILGVIAAAVKDRNPALCARMPDNWPQAGEICRLTTAARVEAAGQIMSQQAYLGGHETRNVLLEKADNQSYKDTAVSKNVTSPGWSWNAKFADLDQDGWQDIYVATAEHFGSRYGPNAFYHNKSGRTFDEEAKRFGLSDLVPTTSYLLNDFDRDGDVDMIRAPGMAEPVVHRNDSPVGPALWISLRDELGNSFGVGARIQIQTSAPADSIQVRELKASGGFNSFDAPKVHFGLGKARAVSGVTVTWRDGAVTVFRGLVPGNSELVIRRKSASN